MTMAAARRSPAACSPPSAIAVTIQTIVCLQGIRTLVQVKLIGRLPQSSNSEQFETCTLLDQMSLCLAVSLMAISTFCPPSSHL